MSAWLSAHREMLLRALWLLVIPLILGRYGAPRWACVGYVCLTLVLLVEMETLRHSIDQLARQQWRLEGQVRKQRKEG